MDELGKILSLDALDQFIKSIAQDSREASNEPTLPTSAIEDQSRGTA